MTLPMGISEARQLSADELAINDKTVAQAEAEANDAQKLLEALERQAVESTKFDKSKAAPVVEARQIAEFHRARADRTRVLADRAAAANRLLALADLGSSVEQIHADASTPTAGMIAALTAITSAYATLRQLTDAHNGKVKDAVDLARALDAERAAPSGPRASSAHVTVHQGNRKVQSGSRIVQLVDRRAIDDAVELAVKGDTDAAVRRLSAAHTVAPPHRHDHYVVGTAGGINGHDDPLPREWAKQIKAGKMHELDDGEVQAFLEGRYHGYQAGT